MLSDLDQLYDQMAQVSREFQQIQSRWNEILRQVKELSREFQVPHGRNGCSVSALAIKSTSSYGARYAMTGHPFGMSEMSSRSYYPSPPMSPFQLSQEIVNVGRYSVREQPVCRQSEHTSYGRMM